MEKVFKNKKTGEIAYYKDGVLKVDNCAVEIGHEPSLEFWDLVEDTFKILTVFGLADTSGNIYEVINENQIKHTGTNLIFDTISPITEFRIHSVKRLSDGEIFTVGDKAKSNGGRNSHYIESFQISKKSKMGEKGDWVGYGENLIWVRWADHAGGSWLNDVEKVKEEIILTTNDGVNLKFGDKYFVASPESYQIFEASAGITFKTERWKGRGFSTRELAEEWVLMNKPLLSLEDLLSVWGVEPKKEVYNISPLFVRFKELADKKLKN
jgi:hypothetical protein